MEWVWCLNTHWLGKSYDFKSFKWEYTYIFYKDYKKNSDDINKKCWMILRNMLIQKYL